MVSFQVVLRGLFFDAAGPLRQASLSVVASLPQKYISGRHAALSPFQKLDGISKPYIPLASAFLAKPRTRRL